MKKIIHYINSYFPDPIRIVPFTIFFAIAAIMWDSWWHVVVGRDTFFIPPHDLIYISLVVGFLAVIAEIVSQRKPFKKIDKRLLVLFLTQILIFVAAPLDEVWHRIFGEEPITSVLIFWSPPHLILFLSVIVGGLALFLYLIERFKNSYVLHLFTATSVFTIAQFMIGPLIPIALHHVLGFYGALIIVLITVSLLIFFAKHTRITGTATIVSLMYLAFILSAQPGSVEDMITDFPVHPHSPTWLIFFSLIIGGFIIDGFAKRMKGWIVGTLYGFVTSFLLYSATLPFIEPNFLYSTQDLVVAILAGTVGGLIGGILNDTFYTKSLKNA